MSLAGQLGTDCWYRPVNMVNGTLAQISQPCFVAFFFGKVVPYLYEILNLLFAVSYLVSYLWCLEPFSPQFTPSISSTASPKIHHTVDPHSRTVSPMPPTHEQWSQIFLRRSTKSPTPLSLVHHGTVAHYYGVWTLKLKLWEQWLWWIR
jgi:hypothetical protein